MQQADPDLNPHKPQACSRSSVLSCPSRHSLCSSKVQSQLHPSRQQVETRGVKCSAQSQLSRKISIFMVKASSISSRSSRVRGRESQHFSSGQSMQNLDVFNRAVGRESILGLSMVSKAASLKPACLETVYWKAASEGSQIESVRSRPVRPRLRGSTHELINSLDSHGEVSSGIHSSILTRALAILSNPKGFFCSLQPAFTLRSGRSLSAGRVPVTCRIFGSLDVSKWLP